MYDPSFQSGLTAAGTTQATALVLTGTFNEVTTAAAASGVRLPASEVGKEVKVANRGANPLKVYGASTDTINSIATATGVVIGTGTVATFICNAAGNWEMHLPGGVQLSPVAVGASGAIDPHTSQVYVLNKAGVAAMTLAAPTAGTDDGVIIEVTSDTAQAHTITFTGNTLDSGSANAAVATFAAQKGASVRLMAFNARWKALSQVGITFS